MRHKTYFYTVATVFLLVALAHLARVLFGWDMQIDLLGVPMWISILAVIVIGYLAYRGFKLAHRSQD